MSELNLQSRYGDLSLASGTVFAEVKADTELQEKMRRRAQRAVQRFIAKEDAHETRCYGASLTSVYYRVRGRQVLKVCFGPKLVTVTNGELRFRVKNHVAQQPSADVHTAGNSPDSGALPQS